MTPSRIRRAAEVLRESAARLKQLHSYASDGEWAARDIDRDAQKRHDEMLALAEELDALAVFMAQLIEAAQVSGDVLGIASISDSFPVDA